MSPNPLDLIPAARREPARAALNAAFGTASITALRPISGGASGALTYRVEVARGAYLLRLETARDPFRNPQRGYACMRRAADAGIAPRLHHADPSAGVAIMDFIEARPLREYPGGASARLREIGNLVRTLQATETFPPLLDYATLLDRMLSMLCDSGLFSPGLLDRHRAGFEHIREAYPWHAATPVSSHNDLNPGNILFDGVRLWLIDWEIAFCNDPLADLAIVALNFAATPELQEVLLQAWLGRTPDPNLRARLVVMRQLALLFYACLMLSSCIGQRAALGELPSVDLAHFHAHAQARLFSGVPVDLYSDGLTLLGAFAASLATPEFERLLTLAGASNTYAPRDIDA